MRLRMALRSPGPGRLDLSSSLNFFFFLMKVVRAPRTGTVGAAPREKGVLVEKEAAELGMET